MSTDRDVATRRLAAFVERVEGLLPAEWGRLDAAGARLLAADPAAFIDRSLYLGRAAGGITGAGELLTVPAVAALQAGGWALRNITDGVRIVLDLPTLSSQRRSVTEELRRATSNRAGAGSRETESMSDLIERVATSALNAAGGEGLHKGSDPAFLVLLGALMAIASAERFGPRTTAQLYEPVEPVIPWSSLENDNRPPAALPPAD